MANVDWSKLTFSYTKTNTILTTTFRNGEWSPVESHTDDYMKVSAYCGAFHYAIECFEGLKAFRGKDGKVRLFRPEENALRLRRSAEYLGIVLPLRFLVPQYVQRRQKRFTAPVPLFRRNQLESRDLPKRRGRLRK